MTGNPKKVNLNEVFEYPEHSELLIGGGVALFYPRSRKKRQQSQGEKQ